MPLIKKILTITIILFSFASFSLAEEEVSFNHSLYQKILFRYMDKGFVDYIGLKRKRFDLDRYLTLVSNLEPESITAMSGDERIALYINVYNARVLQTVVDHYPVKSINKIEGWDTTQFKVAGGYVTLTQIKNEIIPNETKDPRVYFTLIDAAKGAPALRQKPFQGRNRNALLDDTLRKFINDKSKNRLDKKENIIYLSSLLKEYKPRIGSVLLFVSKYLPRDQAEFIKKNNPPIKYEHDESLNIRPYATLK
ncbi:MAG: DUF547 domain-containing protein [PVC group bacterium]|nr:DUF547 domain-containing protein [PVC group bacterium]